MVENDDNTESYFYWEMELYGIRIWVFKSIISYVFVSHEKEIGAFLTRVGIEKHEIKVQ